MTVVLAMDIDQELRRHLREQIRKDVELAFPADMTQEEVLPAASGAEVVVGVTHLAEILEANPSVRLVQVPWAGVEGPVSILRDHPDVLLTNSHSNAFATAQYGVSMLLALLTRMVEAHGVVVDGRWSNRDALPPSDLLRGKTVGILGTGHIGRSAARILQGFEVRIIGMRRRAAEATDPFDAIFGRDDLDEVISASDILFITLPGTQDTWHMIGAGELDALGPDGYLVNIGRGEVVDETAVFEALRDRRIAGAAIDVWYEYEPDADQEGRSYPYRQPFHELDNVVLSPHRAGNAKPSLSDWDAVIDNINRLAQGRTDLLNIIDIERGY